MTNKTKDFDAEKSVRICKAAIDQFAMYGFRRTSMEDIAQASGMSRAALYLHFKNKEDIYRKLVRLYYLESETALKAALAGNGDVETILTSAFLALAGPSLQPLLDSPHGKELLDSHGAISPHIIVECEATLAGLLAAWLEKEAAAGRIMLDRSALETANVMKGAMKGIKLPPYQTFIANRDQLAILFARGLRA